MQNKKILFVLLYILAISTLVAQAKRADAIWARTVPAGSITIDGKMNEAVWAQAESMYVQYGKNAGLPGSGFTAETGTVFDSIRAVIKFLVMGDSLYIGFTVKDSSIGGGIFGTADAFIFNIRDKSDVNKRPASPGEYLWGWIDESWMNPGNVTSVGAMPKEGPNNKYTKTDYQTATTVKGITNSDDKPDTSYTVELKINLKPKGYSVSSTEGDIVMFSGAFRDCDWFWPVQDWVTFSRVWIQSPWANVNLNSHLRIYVRPNVTNSSGPVPAIPADFSIANGKNIATPNIDGKLDEAVWKFAPSVAIKFGDNALRNTYPSTGPFRSGEFQPEINGLKAQVADPADATIKMFYKNNFLYVGVNVNDKVVQSHNSYDRWDGVMLTINGLGKDHENDIDHNQLARKLTMRFDKNGQVLLADYLNILVDSMLTTKAKGSLLGATTVDTLGLDEDTGYQFEYEIDLTKLGYTTPLDNKFLYIGATIFDGDSYIPTSLSYGTRTWWFREHDGADGPAVALLDEANVLTAVQKNFEGAIPNNFVLYGNYPNPFNPSTTIKYGVPFAGTVTLEVFNILGQQVANQYLGTKDGGEHTYSFKASRLNSGVYFYRLHLIAEQSGKEFYTALGKFTLLK